MMDRKFRAVWLTERFWRKNKLAHSFALLSVVALAATGTFAVEDSAKVSGAGLSGIFPSAPPADLSEDEFAKLDGNWTEWSKGAASAVAEFYSKLDGSDAAVQRQALGVLKVKLDVIRRALEDARYRSLQAPLTSLNNSLSLRIDFAEAALDTLEAGAEVQSSGKIKARSAELVSAIKALETYLASIPNGSLWLGYFKADALKTALTADPEGADAIAAATQSAAKLQTRAYVLDSTQKEFTHRPAFETYANAVGLYSHAASWKNSDEATKKLRAELKTLATSLDTYATTSENTAELRQAFAKVRLASADGGERIASALQKRLFNYNLRLLLTEDFLNKLMSQKRTESGPVSDFVLGAAVSGNQITNTTVGVDLKPSNTTARFDIKLNGAISSDTQGVTSQATVWTHGSHTFVATKEINFDGLKFSTLPAQINVYPRNTTTGIATGASGMPIFGQIANRIASDQVEAKRGEAEAITASRVRERVLPRFNSEVDSSFATQGQQLDKELFAGLRSTNLFPDAYSYQTTDRLMTVNARLMADNQVGADLPEASLLVTRGATALMHESILNNSIDQIGIAGQTLTEPELRTKIEGFLTKALNRPFKFEAPAPAEANAGEEEQGLKAIIFAAADPIRIRVLNGELTLIIRAGFKQEGKDDIPAREITVPISLEVQGQQIAVKRGNVVVTSAEGQGGGISINAVVRKKIQSVLPDRLVDGKVELKAPETTMVAYVTNIKLVDGWIAISID